MFRRNSSEQSLCRKMARIPYNKKLPLDFFQPNDSFQNQFIKQQIRLSNQQNSMNYVNPFKQNFPSNLNMNRNQVNKIMHNNISIPSIPSTAPECNLKQRKRSFEFTFYRSHSNQQKIQQKNNLYLNTNNMNIKISKLSKRQVFQKFNIKLPHIKSAQTGVQRIKKLHKVKIQSKFLQDKLFNVQNITNSPIR